MEVPAHESQLIKSEINENTIKEVSEDTKQDS